MKFLVCFSDVTISKSFTGEIFLHWCTGGAPVVWWNPQIPNPTYHVKGVISDWFLQEEILSDPSPNIHFNLFFGGIMDPKLSTKYYKTHYEQWNHQQKSQDSLTSREHHLFWCWGTYIDFTNPSTGWPDWISWLWSISGSRIYLTNIWKMISFMLHLTGGSSSKFCQLMQISSTSSHEIQWLIEHSCFSLDGASKWYVIIL